MLSRRGMLAGAATFLAAPAVSGERTVVDPFPEVHVEMVGGKIRQFVYDDGWTEIAVLPADPYPTLAQIMARRSLT